MEGLDLLKQHWDKRDDFPKVNKTEITNMLHKSSSSIVKWIFIICCIEILFWNSLALILPQEAEKSVILEVFNIIFSVAFYAILIYFIVSFYRLYKKIKNTIDAKSLMESIIAVRKKADLYIKFNLWCINIGFVLAFIKMVNEELNSDHGWGKILFISCTFAIIITLLTLLFRFIMKYYYKLVYGILLKKLNNNYEELIKLEE